LAGRRGHEGRAVQKVARGSASCDGQWPPFETRTIFEANLPAPARFLDAPGSLGSKDRVYNAPIIARVALVEPGDPAV